MQTNLKLCPFCGKEIEIVCIGGGWFWRHKNNSANELCTIAWHKKYNSYEEAAEAWNSRVS